jgi:hypothetical protein
MKKTLAILVCLSLLSCKKSQEERWAYHVLDSLGRIEAPLILDTALFRKQLAGREFMDTVINKIAIHRHYHNQFAIFSARHIDSLIANEYLYDVDGRLITWSRKQGSENIHIASIGRRLDYTKWYNKKGKIEHFGLGDQGYDPVPLPKITIYKLIEKLENEGINLFNDLFIWKTVANPEKIVFEFDGTTYYKENWQVGVIDYYDEHKDYMTVHWREIDSDTGEVVREWSKSQGIE